MPSEPISFVWLANKAWVLLVGWFWWEKKEGKKDDKERDDRLSAIELSIASANYVTEEQVKEAIQEALGPYKEDQQEIKLLLKDLNSSVMSLSRDVAVQNAIRSLKNEQQNDTVGGQ